MKDLGGIIIRMMVMCNANAVMEYDIRRQWLSNAQAGIANDNQL